MNKNNLVETLKEISFLQGIEPANLERLANIAQVCTFETEDVVFREGEPAESVYFVISGKLSLELSPETAFRKQLATVGPGEMLGWSSFVESPRFAATAIAIAPARLVRIDGVRLRSMCDTDRQFGYEFMRRTMRTLAARLTETWRQLSYVYLSHHVPITASNVERDL